jgi:hypothetical protein
MLRNWKLLIFLSLLHSLSLPMWALNPEYNFSIVAISGQTIDGIELAPGFTSFTPCINDLGEIVFGAGYQVSPGNFDTALFTPQHVIIKPGDVIDGQALTGLGGCSLNNSGDLLFDGGLSSGYDALFRKNRGSAPTKVIFGGKDKIDGIEPLFFPYYIINDLGQVVFSAYYKCNRAIEVGIFTPEAVIAARGFKIDTYVLRDIDFRFALSSRQLYFHAFNGPYGEGIFTPHTLIAKTGDVISGFELGDTGNGAFNYLTTSDRGELVFSGTYQNGSGIFTTRSLLETTSGLGPTPAAVNNRGTLVYAGDTGLFVNNTLLIDSNGDSVDGHIVNGFRIPAAINNRGDIIVEVDFTDGNQGIILATPKHWKP